MEAILVLVYTIVIFGIALYFMILLANFLRTGIKAFQIYIDNNKKF